LTTSKSAVSRRFVDQTETALAELLAADLSGAAVGRHRWQVRPEPARAQESGRIRA